MIGLLKLHTLDPKPVLPNEKGVWVRQVKDKVGSESVTDGVFALRYSFHRQSIVPINVIKNSANIIVSFQILVLIRQLSLIKFCKWIGLQKVWIKYPIK